MAAQLGCPDPATALDCLRALPAQDLLPVSSIFTRWVFGNDILPEDPRTALLEGRFTRVPVISGATQDEARLFVALFHDLAGMPVTDASYPDLLTSPLAKTPSTPSPTPACTSSTSG